MNTETAAKTKLHYAWIVAGVTFFILLITAGIRATPSILMVPLQHEFGWTTAAISGAIAVQHRAVRHYRPLCGVVHGALRRSQDCFAGARDPRVWRRGSSLMHQRWELVLFWGILVVRVRESPPSAGRCSGKSLV